MGLFYHQFFTVRDDAFIYPSEQYYIDVRDFAEASISALEIREAGGERFLITSGQSHSLPACQGGYLLLI